MNSALLDKVRNSYKFRKLSAAVNHSFWAAAAPIRRFNLPAEIARRAEVNIHFGCGTIADERFINIDARAMRHVHFVTRSPMLSPFASNSADLVYACHVFEHLSFHQQKKVLTRWFEILKPGGRIMLSVPDFDKLVDKFIANDRNPRTIQEPLMGGQDYPGNFHFAIFTAGHLQSLLKACGFVDIAPWHPRDERSWPQDWSWSDWVSLNLSARKPK